MFDTTSQLLSIRPAVETQPAVNTAEKFQNDTLRPVLKLLNDNLVRVFRHYVLQRKSNFFELNLTDQKLYIADVLKKDQKFNSLVKGMVIGHFTEYEWNGYVGQEQEINRRISNLIEQRIVSNLSS